MHSRLSHSPIRIVHIMIVQLIKCDIHAPQAAGPRASLAHTRRLYIAERPSLRRQRAEDTTVAGGEVEVAVQLEEGGGGGGDGVGGVRRESRQ